MNRGFFFIVFLCTIYGMSVGNSYATIPNADTPESLLKKGRSLLQQGSFAQAAVELQKAANLCRTPAHESLKTKILFNLATAYQETGNFQSAINTLLTAQSILEKTRDDARLAQTYSLLSDVYLMTGNFKTAEAFIKTAVERIHNLNQPGILAGILNNLGNVNMVMKAYPEAIEAYEECMNIADELGLRVLKAKAMINRVHAFFMERKYQKAASELDSIIQFIMDLPDSLFKASALVSSGILAVRITDRFDSPDTHLIQQAFRVLSNATTLSDHHNNQRVTSLAYGYLGKLYENEKQYDAAMRLTRSAVFYAQQQDAPDILYRWQWQQGRLFKALDQPDRAISVYRHAVQNLQSVRRNFTLGFQLTPNSFRESIGPVYYELAELLINKAESCQNQKEQAFFLLEARNTIELLKTAELKDYFQDECVTELQSKVKSLDQLSGHTAVIYPVPLAERLVLLLTLPDGIRQFNVQIEAKTLDQTVDTFRYQLQNRINHRYIKNSKKLYSWLIRPLEKALTEQHIDTLIIVPDGKLRTIPFAALHSGKQFLIDRYAVSVIPGLTLTESRGLDKTDFHFLINGLSKGVQGFSPLPNVPHEIENIKDLASNKIFLDRDFSPNAMEQEMRSIPYSVVHIASHGQFKSDPRETFILTFDDKLRMDQLSRFIRFSRFRDKPVELLTLSACETAVGDDRAALGLAGVAVKAGARSALATLWFVDDAATSILITDFYKELRNPEMTKAKALQNAQKKLLKKRKFRHPFYWAPYLLIGNWL